MDKKVLDVCCGSKMMWFQPNCDFVEFCDIRDEEIELCDGRICKVHPDTIADFRNLPHENESFNLVVFDPPHLIKAGDNSWLKAKYGRLDENWKEDIKKGFEECWRTLKVNGTFIFKWSEEQISVSDVLKLFHIKPIFGHRRGKTLFLVFFKEK